MNKKAIHHVEYIIAISIFIVGVFFVIYFSNVEHKETLPINDFESLFKDQVQIRVTKIVLNPETSIPPIKIPRNSKIPEDSKKVFITNGISMVNFNIDSSHIELPNSEKYYIYFSDSFNNQQSGIHGTCSEPNYAYSIPIEQKFISEKKLRNLVYENLKDLIKKDFAIKVTFPEETLEIKKEEPLNVQVHAKEFRSKVINPETGEINDVLINLILW